MNSDIHENVALVPESLTWSATETTGLERALLDRVDWESSFLRASAGTAFVSEGLSTGEEYLVLSGSLEGDDLGVGSYLRFPPGSKRRLVAGPEGAVVFQKTGHFEESDQQIVSTGMIQDAWRQGMVEGLSVMPLYQHGHESIAFVKWAPHTQFNPHVHPGGEEIIVIDGTFHDEHGSYPTGSWIRNKPYSKHTPHTEADGALIYVKTGHLPPQ